MKIDLILLALFVMPFFIFQITGQKNDNARKTNAELPEQFVHEARTPDYLCWNDTVYLMSQSPLSTYANYKNIYDEFPEISAANIQIQYGAGIEPLGDKYYLDWIIRDSMLYLQDVGFYFLLKEKIKKIFPRNEQYGVLEKLTRVKFSRKNISAGAPQGLMPATWFSGNIQLKARIRKKESIGSWLGQPFFELTFQNGKIESARVIGEKTEKGKKQQMTL